MPKYVCFQKIYTFLGWICFTFLLIAEEWRSLKTLIHNLNWSVEGTVVSKEPNEGAFTMRGPGAGGQQGQAQSSLDRMQGGYRLGYGPSQANP